MSVGRVKGLAEAFLAVGSKHEAIHTYRRILSIEDDQAARLALAELYQSDQSFLDAISRYQGALEREPRNAALVEALAICHAAIVKTKKALVLFQRANELEDGRLLALDGMARILARYPIHVDSDNAASLRYALAATEIKDRRLRDRGPGSPRLPLQSGRCRRGSRSWARTTEQLIRVPFTGAKAA